LIPVMTIGSSSTTMTRIAVVGLMVVTLPEVDDTAGAGDGGLSYQAPDANGGNSTSTRNSSPRTPSAAVPPNNSVRSRIPTRPEPDPVEVRSVAGRGIRAVVPGSRPPAESGAYCGRGGISRFPGTGFATEIFAPPAAETATSTVTGEFGACFIALVSASWTMR